jgi:hypothetical protein
VRSGPKSPRCFFSVFSALAGCPKPGSR